MNTVQKEWFYKRLNELIKERGWSVYELAKESQLPHSTVYNMFKRHSEPRMETYRSILDGLGMTKAEFEITLNDSAKNRKISILTEIAGDMTEEYIDRLIEYAKFMKEIQQNQ